MRLSATSFTHTSTAMFGVAVVGYAAARLVSFAAPYAVPHLPGHHGAAAHAQLRVQSVRQEPQRASRSAHRAAAPTLRAVHGPGPASTTTKGHDSWPPLRTGDATTVPLDPAGQPQRDVEPRADRQQTIEQQLDRSQLGLQPTDDGQGWSRPSPTPTVAGADDGTAGATSDPTADPTPTDESDATDEPDEPDN